MKDINQFFYPSEPITVQAGKKIEFLIKPLPEVADTFRDSHKHATFWARVTKPDRIVNAYVRPGFNEELGGYVIDIDIREEGDYTLEVYLGWIYGDEDEHDGIEPILLSSHMGHSYQLCNSKRSLIFGSPWLLKVQPPDSPLQLFGTKKCSTGTEDGRWIYQEVGTKCQPPYCFGTKGFGMSVGGMGWSGEKIPWTWVPYTCYFNFYSNEDIDYCAKKSNIDWLLVQGDSQVREVLGHLNLLAGLGDVYGKFAALERPNLFGDLRVSYYFQANAYQNVYPNKEGKKFPFSRGHWPYLHHFNIVPSCSSGLPISYYLPNQVNDLGIPKMSLDVLNKELLNFTETDRPDTLIWNAGMAYAAESLAWSDFQQYVEDTCSYFGNGKLIQNHGEDITSELDNYITPERLSEISGSLAPGAEKEIGYCKTVSDIPKKKLNIMKSIWYSPPFIFSQAHPNSPWLTTHRVSKYHQHTKSRFEKIGVKILDTNKIFQSRWEECYDGIHFMRSTIDDPGHGLASAMVTQMALNLVFPDCDPIE